jgi:hypothetical protein
MIRYTIIVQDAHGAEVESETVSGNTPRTALAARCAMSRILRDCYPSDHSLKVTRTEER